MDLTEETLIPVSKAWKYLATLKTIDGPLKVHRLTPCRWCSHGPRGHKLEFIRLGKVNFTSAEAIKRFIASCSGKPIPPPRRGGMSKEEARRLIP